MISLRFNFLCLLYFRATSDMCSYITSPNVLFTCCLWSCERAGQGYFKGEFHSQAWIVWWIVSNGCFYFCQISNFISHNLRKRHIKGGTMIKKSFPFFLSILKAYSLIIQLAKSWALCFIRRLFILSVSFGFHGPALLTLKTDR